MPVPSRSGSGDNRWYKNQSQGASTPSGSRRRYSTLSLAAPPPGGPGSSEANVFGDNNRYSPPRKRRGPATGLRLSGLQGDAFKLNGEYTIQETGRFKQQDGSGLLVHRDGKWRLSYTHNEHECFASSGPLLGQWAQDCERDSLQGPYPYVVATETRDDQVAQLMSQAQQPPGPPAQVPTFVPRSADSELSMPPGRPDGWESALRAQLDTANQKSAELTRLLDEEREEQRREQHRRADESAGRMLEEHNNEKLRRAEERAERLTEEHREEVRRMAEEHAGRMVDVMREKETLLEQVAGMRRQRDCEMSVVRAEVDAEMLNHRKTAAGADIAISDYRKIVLQVEEDLFNSRQNEGRISVLFEESEEFCDLLIWHLAPLNGVNEAGYMAIRSERLAHEQTAAELAQQMQIVQDLQREKSAFIAELEAERAAQQKTALGAEHLARELEAWRNDVKDTMLTEEAQTQVKLARAKGAEEQAAKMIELLKDEVAELKMQLSGAEAKASAEQADKTRIMTELRDHLDEAQKSSSTEARVREELLIELQEARRKAQTSDILREENFGGRLELLAVTAKMQPKLGPISMDPSSYTQRIDEITNHLGAFFLKDNDTRQTEKESIDVLQKRIESLTMQMEAKQSQIQAQQSQLESNEAALKVIGAETEEVNNANRELKGIIEDLNGRAGGMQEASRRIEELEAVSVQQLSMLNDMSNSLAAAQQELNDVKQGGGDKREELENEMRRLRGEVSRLEVELKNATVEEGMVQELTRRVQEFELQTDVTSGLVEADARIKALEQSSQEEKDTLQRRIKELEGNLMPRRDLAWDLTSRPDNVSKVSKVSEVPSASNALEPVSFFASIKEPVMPSTYASRQPKNLSPARSRAQPHPLQQQPVPQALQTESIWASKPTRPVYPHTASVPSGQSMHDWLNAYKRY